MASKMKYKMKLYRYSKRGKHLNGFYSQKFQRDSYFEVEQSHSLDTCCIFFRTILYEIFLEVYPHVQEHLEVIIWNFSCGRKLNDLEDIPFSVGNVSC